MHRLRQVIHEIRRRRLWRVLGIYLVASWAVLQVVDTLGGALNLPDWFPSLALALLAVGLPTVLAVAYVQVDIVPKVDEPDAQPALARSIAVLPFDDLSPAKDQQYFVEGLSEEIINALTQIDGLKVSARTSTFILAAQRTDVTKLAQTLGVANVLEGSVRKSGERVRITAQLIEAESSFHLWSHTFDRELSDIFAVQDEIARAIADKLQVTLVGATEQLVAAPTGSRDAHEAYLRGRHFWGQRTKQGLHSAVQEFTRAIELDPEYAEAYSGLADTYNVWELYTGLQAATDYRGLAAKAMAAAQEAARLAPNLGMARTSLARAHMKSGEWADAATEFDAALRLSPGYATAHYWYGLYCWYTGRPRDGTTHLERAVQLDPVSQSVRSVLGLVLTVDGRYAEGADALRRAITLDPKWATGWRWLGLGNLHAGKYEESLEAFRRAHGLLAGDLPFPEHAIREAHAAIARYKRTGEPASDETVERLGMDPLRVIAYSALMGNRAITLAFYTRLVRAGAYELAANLHVWFLGEALADDPRYQALLDEAGITW